MDSAPHADSPNRWASCRCTIDAAAPAGSCGDAAGRPAVGRLQMHLAPCQSNREVKPVGASRGIDHHLRQTGFQSRTVPLHQAELRRAELIRQFQQMPMAGECQDFESPPLGLTPGRQRCDHQHAQSSRPEHRDRLAFPGRHHIHRMKCGGEGFHQHTRVVGDLIRQWQHRPGRSKDPRTEAARKIVNTQHESLGTMGRQAA